MSPIRIAALLLLLVVGGCAHHAGHRPSSGVPQATVSSIKVGNTVLPLVDREPFVIRREAALQQQAERPSNPKTGDQRDDPPITLSWAPGADVTGVRIRILDYLDLRSPSASAAQRFKELTGTDGERCPLVDSVRERKRCTCPNVDGKAVCTFRSSQPAVFRYDICVTSRLGEEKTEYCVDPYGMIN